MIAIFVTDSIFKSKMLKTFLLLLFENRVPCFKTPFNLTFVLDKEKKYQVEFEDTY